jgi:hypothetical protein
MAENMRLKIILVSSVGFALGGLNAILSCPQKCLKFKVPKMPKVKDDNHF